MANFLEIDARDIWFVADTHFQSRRTPGEKERRVRFVRFLDALPAGCALFLLGDIFDFYFEYRTVVTKRYFDLYCALERCRSREVALHFLGGNHDFWVGDFVTCQLGFRLHHNEILLATQGRRLVCAHGDLVMPRDYGYKILKFFLRNRLVIGAARWIHPDLMDALARGVAVGSRKLSHASQKKRASRLADLAHDRFFSRGNDIFIMGHVHSATHDVRDGREFMILGDWVDHFTYGRLKDGRLSLERFTDGTTR
jgi:UDP-2,3-diacylglucosamine hydrolase